MIWAAVGGALLATQAGAQNLTSFVTTAPGATQLQINAGEAVQRMCTYLSNVAGYKAAPTGGPSLGTATGDLFLRCNELVETAKTYQAVAGQTRSLGYGAPALLGAVQQISGVQVASQGTLATQVPSGQFANISNRLNALRYGATSIALSGRVTAASTPITDTYHYGADFSGGADDPESGAQFLHAVYGAADAGSSSTGANPSSSAGAQYGVTNPWGLFTEGSYDWGNRDQTSAEDGFDYHAESVTVGLDYNFGGAVAGLSAGYDTYKAAFNANGSSVAGGESKVDGTTGSVFAAWFGQAWTVNGILSYGPLRTTLARAVNYTYIAGSSCAAQMGITACGANRILTGSPNGTESAAGLTAGYDAYAGNWRLSPTLSVNYRRIRLDAFSETDSADASDGLPLAYDAQTIESLRSVTGLSVTRPLSYGWGVLGPLVKIEWDHEFKNAPRSLDAYYVSDISGSGSCATRTSCFQLPIQGATKDFGTAGAGLTALFSNRLQGYLYYERLLGVSYLTSNSITLGIRGQL
jgi:uncharacterized protein YhjY with autotransporter beta-barrel domain